MHPHCGANVINAVWVDDDRALAVTFDLLPEPHVIPSAADLLEPAHGFILPLRRLESLMSVPQLLVVIAALCLFGAAIYAAVNKAWIAALVCTAGCLLVFAGFLPDIT